ncbi:MAG: F0F1 ATP synthase subunit epsilon [Firmicutes bacterium]|nr:F0F1 ATP synthase subunit epsilon [Bacillota bacterium]
MDVALEVITPDRVVLRTQVTMVSLRGGGGELGILARHTPLSTTVKPGIVKLKLPQGEDFLAVASGFLQVVPDRITLLVDTAEVGSQIETERAQRARERAEKRLAEGGPDVDMVRAQAALERAMRRLEVSEMSAVNGEILKQLL